MPQLRIPDVGVLNYGDAAGVEKAIVVGHAGGGGGAIAFAARYPGRTVALIGVDTSSTPASPPDSDAYRWMKDFADSIRDKPGEFERRYRTFFGPRVDPALVDAVVASALKTPIQVASAELMGLATTDTVALARQVTAPVLWVTAGRSMSRRCGRCSPTSRPPSRSARATICNSRSPTSSMR